MTPVLATLVAEIDSIPAQVLSGEISTEDYLTRIDAIHRMIQDKGLDREWVNFLVERALNSRADFNLIA